MAFLLDVYVKLMVVAVAGGVVVWSVVVVWNVVVVLSVVVVWSVSVNVAVV